MMLGMCAYRIYRTQVYIRARASPARLQKVLASQHWASMSSRKTLRSLFFRSCCNAMSKVGKPASQPASQPAS